MARTHIPASRDQWHVHALRRVRPSILLLGGIGIALVLLVGALAVQRGHAAELVTIGVPALLGATGIAVAWLVSRRR